MAYQLDSALWRGVFAVPGTIVDEHLKLCDESALKVLLFILRKNGETSPDEITSFLGLGKPAVEQAVGYWVNLGVLQQPAPLPAPPVEEPAAQSAPTPAANLPGKTRPKLTTRQINDMSRSDDTIAFLLREAQMIIGKPLTPVATDTIAALYSYYGMNPEVLLMLLQYCTSQKQDNMRYIEKVAASWIEKGIDTSEKAEREILAGAEQASHEAAIRRILGIHDRALISSEREFIAGWKDAGISNELVGLAYERTVEQKGKLSLPYINGILQNWKQKGISTPAQALQEMRTGKKTPEGTATGSSDEMEQIYKYGDV